MYKNYDTGHRVGNGLPGHPCTHAYVCTINCYTIDDIIKEFNEHYQT